MITIKVIETKIINKLAIENDSDSDSPRSWSNLGYFITVDRNFYSPDENQELINIMKEAGNIATSQKEHLELIKDRIYNEIGEKVVAIYPICKYEHSGINYSLGTKNGFDYSNCGFYIITEKTQKEVGTNEKDWEKVINQELENYNKWVNGEIYRYMIFDETGEVADSCGGFYDIEDIRDYLPAEFQNENLSDYIKN